MLRTASTVRPIRAAASSSPWRGPTSAFFARTKFGNSVQQKHEAAMAELAELKRQVSGC
jgi:hypothetical protein